jgi:hypothetical protein
LQKTRKEGLLLIISSRPLVNSKTDPLGLQEADARIVPKEVEVLQEAEEANRIADHRHRLGESSRLLLDPELRTTRVETAEAVVGITIVGVAIHREEEAAEDKAEILAASQKIVLSL